MIITKVQQGISALQPRESKGEVMYGMIQRWRRKLQAIAMMMRFAYMMRSGIAACDIFCMVVLKQFVQ